VGSTEDEKRARLVGNLVKPVADLELAWPYRPRPLRPLYRLVDRLTEKVRGRGLDTTRHHVGIDHFHPDRVAYQPSGWWFLQRALRRRDVEADDVFLELGAGQGVVMFQAARYPFTRVLGIEVSPELVADAEANIERNRDRLACQDVEVIQADAAEFTIPDDVTVAYMYHPFAGDTFRAVVSNIAESLERRPRRFRVIYACPAFEQDLLASGKFRLLRKSRGGPRDLLARRVCVYVHEP
jgi:SAM-dependent methyltransferase